MRIAVVLGTRPEIIKLSPILNEAAKRSIDLSLIHTNQHYSVELDKIFFAQLKLKSPDFNLEIGSGEHGATTGRMLEKIEIIYKKIKPDIVIVQGDTNSVLSGALAAAKMHIKVAHIEAGLRSYDHNMPEEINRIMVDHISDFLFAPTENARGILLKENIDQRKIYVTGNTVADALFNNARTADASFILDFLDLDKKRYVLSTLHRKENVDEKNRLEKIIAGLCLVQQKTALPVIIPAHPRLKKMLKEFHIDTGSLELINPLGYLDFLKLEKEAALIATDSGGIQEEACILHVPCITLRDNTERPETVSAGANILCSVKPEKILQSAKQMLNSNRKWNNPFGEGRAARKILNILCPNKKC